jgi:hypothetical protein
MSTGISAVARATLLGGLEIALEDTMVDYITQWTQDDVTKVKHTSQDPSYSDPESQTWTYGRAAVHAGMLPKNEVGMVLVDQIPVFPFILCHITKGKDEMPEGIVWTKLIVGVWDDDTDYQGYRDAVAMLRKLMRCIWWLNTLAQTYQMNVNEGTEWRIYDSNEVSWPFFICEGTIGWRQRTPFLAAESEGLDYEPQPNIVPGTVNIPVWQPSVPFPIVPIP